MAFKEMSPKLQLSFDEYVETWRSLLTEYFSRALDGEITDDILALDAEALGRYSVELSAVVLTIGARICNSAKRLNDELRGKVIKAVEAAFYEGLFKDRPPEFKEEYMTFYQAKSGLFAQLCPDIAGKSVEKQNAQLAGMARYLAAQASTKPEQENLAAIERIGVHLVQMANVLGRLMKNTSPDVQLPGRPKFIVQK